jgi:hypothetical protein
MEKAEMGRAVLGSFDDREQDSVSFAEDTSPSWTRPRPKEAVRRSNAGRKRVSAANQGKNFFETKEVRGFASLSAAPLTEGVRSCFPRRFPIDKQIRCMKRT